MIMKKRVSFKSLKQQNIELSDDCKDFITRLLDKNPDYRLGSGGIQEVLSHPWLSKLDSSKILAKTIEAPMKPKLSSNPLDVSNFA